MKDLKQYTEFKIGVYGKGSTYASIKRFTEENDMEREFENFISEVEMTNKEENFHVYLRPVLGSQNSRQHRGLAKLIPGLQTFHHKIVSLVVKAKFSQHVQFSLSIIQIKFSFNIYYSTQPSQEMNDIFLCVNIVRLCYHGRLVSPLFQKLCLADEGPVRIIHTFSSTFNCIFCIYLPVSLSAPGPLVAVAWVWPGRMARRLVT